MRGVLTAGGGQDDAAIPRRRERIGAVHPAANASDWARASLPPHRCGAAVSAAPFRTRGRTVHDAGVQPSGADRRRRHNALVVALVLAIAAAAAAVPFLPAGPDLYVHLLWTWQVMRCAAAGDLPVWLPDLNGGFGSPGIRLYSPLGPVLQGVLGLALGSAGAALRVAPVLAWGVFLLVARRVRGGRTGTAEWALLALSPLALHSLLGRGAWSEYLAAPLLWWLLDAAVAGTFRPLRDGTVLACLWLLHAPTAMMTGALLAGAATLRRDPRAARSLALGGAFAAALTAWHWLPLLDEMRLIDRTALTGGIFEITRNVLGSPSAFALDESIWLGWCAVSLLAALLAGRWWRTDRVRAALVLACVALASPAALWLYRLPLPLDILQFPWRWLLPAAVLAAAPAARGLAGTPGRVAAALLLAPLVLLPRPAFVRDPILGTTTEGRDAGERVWRSFGGNPLLVDASQNRPESFQSLTANLERFGPQLVRVEPAAAAWRVDEWAPSRRVVSISSAAGVTAELRVLDYPLWQVTVDGTPTAGRGGGVIGAAVPAGRHTVAVEWRGNPLAAAGEAIAAGALGAVALLAARRRQRRREAPGAR